MDDKQYKQLIECIRDLIQSVEELTEALESYEPDRTYIFGQ